MVVTTPVEARRATPAEAKYSAEDLISERTSLADAIEMFRSGPSENVSVFPVIFSCPVCSKRLKATHAGRFRCSECKSILAVDSQGQVSLG